MPHSGFDDWVDAQLRNVPVPPDLLERLAQSGPGKPVLSDEEMDALLRQVPVPGYLDSRLRRIARHSHSRIPWGPLSLAASVLLVLGLGAANYLGWFSTERGGRPQLAVQTPAVAPGRSPATRGHSPAGRPSQFASDTPGGPAPPVAEQPEADPASKGSFPLFRSMATLSTSLRQAIEAKRRSMATLGAGGQLDKLPQLDAMDVPAPRGVTPPRVQGYNLLFQLKHGEHPFVSPAAHAELASSRMPFSFRTASYDRALNQARAGQLPAADEIRVEDFLAAQNYRIPPTAAGTLALHSAIIPSPLGDPGLHLLQVAVQAGPARNHKHAPAHLIAVVDTSSPMRSGARWQTFRRAMLKLADQMVPADRVTVIAFAEQPHELAADIGPDALRKLISSAELPEPTGLADFAAAAQFACKTAAKTTGSNRRIVFITSGRGDYEENMLAQATAGLTKLTSEGLVWQTIVLCSGMPCSGAMGSVANAGGSTALSNVDEHLTAMAEEGHGSVASAGSAVDLAAMLFEKLTGESQLVAKGASLKLAFNPKLVRSYRLLGHEAPTLTATAGDPIEIDLSANQTATALYELWIKPAGGEQVVSAELTWTDPHSGRAGRVVQPLRRPAAATSFSQAPAWMQQGIMAAKTAEVLRGSSYVSSSRPVGQLLDLTEQVDPRVAEQADFQSLVELIKLVEKLR